MHLLVALQLLLFLPHQPVYAQSAPGIDGDFSDWLAYPILHIDPEKDAGASGIDFKTIRIAADDAYFYFMIDVGKEITLQSDNNLALYIDTDCSQGTGLQEGTLGAELVWNFGTRKGIVYTSQGSVNITHAMIDLHPAPAITSAQFEFAVRRSTFVKGMPLFPSDSFRVILADRSANGDRLPDSGRSVFFRSSGVPGPPPEPITIDRSGDEFLRLVSWNILQDGLFDSGREPSLTRILRALQPDVICFEEVFDHSAAQVESYLQSVYQSPSGAPWHAYKLDAGNVLATTAIVKQSAAILPNFRESAYLLHPGAPHEADLLLLVNHFRCCTADAERQQEADAVISFLRDAKAGKGSIPLQPETPIVLVGDFNLVGFRQQLTTLLSGDIQDNVRFGPDTAPGWNNRPLENLPLRHLRTAFNYTWRDSTSSFASGKLDYIFLTPEQLVVKTSYVFDSFELTPTELAHYNLTSSDSRNASDHLPCVVDFRVKKPQTGIGAATRSDARCVSFPNPVSSSFLVECESGPGRHVELVMTDLLGRELIRIVGDAGNAGVFRTDVPVRNLLDGVYFLTLSLNGTPSHRQTIIKRSP